MRQIEAIKLSSKLFIYNKYNVIMKQIEANHGKSLAIIGLKMVCP